MQQQRNIIQQQPTRGIAFIPRGVAGSGAPTAEPPLPQGGAQRVQSGVGGGAGVGAGSGGVDGGEKRKRRPRKKRAKLSGTGPAGGSSAAGSDEIDAGLEDEGDDIDDVPLASSSSSSSIADARRKIPI